MMKRYWRFYSDTSQKNFIEDAAAMVGVHVIEHDYQTVVTTGGDYVDLLSHAHDNGGRAISAADLNN